MHPQESIAEGTGGTAPLGGDMFRRLLDSAPDALLVIDASGEIVLANAQAERLFGFSRTELLHEKIEKLVPERFRERHAALRDAFVAAPRTREMGSGLELTALRKDGTEVSVEIRLSPLETDEGLLVSSAIRDITERRRTHRDLVRAKEEAETAGRELEAFSYSVAHDLRAPLRAIAGFARALADECAERLDERGRTYVGYVRDAAAQMGIMIDGLLELSRVARLDLRAEPIDLAGVVRSAAERLRKLHPGRSVELAVGEGVTVVADPRLLSLVVDHLLANAWKFTSGRPVAHVEVGVADVAGRRAIFVRDDGVGFDPARAKRLFGPFQRFHATAEFEGIGIGLAVVERVIRRHGGRVWAEAAVGRGATFFFTVDEGAWPTL